MMRSADYRAVPQAGLGRSLRGRQIVLGIVGLLSAVLFCGASVLPARADAVDDEVSRIQEQIKAHGYSWTAGRTSVMELPLEQRRSLCGLKVPPGKSGVLTPWERDSRPKQGVFPESFNWLDQGIMTPVKNQGPCGSCWAFAAVGEMEAMIKQATGVEQDLSEQQMVSCTQGSCEDGGWPDYCYILMKNFRAVSEACMPYDATDNPPCIQEQCLGADKIQDFYSTGSDVASIKSALLWGPVSTGMTVTDEFAAYSGGCYDGPSSSASVDHLVVIVGWDDAACNGRGAWFCRNSWSEWWGINGYFWIAYGCCQIGGMSEQVVYAPNSAGDIGAGALVNPPDGGSKHVLETFAPRAIFENLGVLDLYGAKLRFRIAGPAPSTAEVYRDSTTMDVLHAGAGPQTITFRSTAIAVPGVYTTCARSDLQGDQNSINDESAGTFTVDCAPSPCPPRACCDPTGACLLASPIDCQPPNTWHEEWADCAPNPCPQLGVCCASATGACTLTLASGCPPPDTWHGQWISCSPNPCSAPGRTCCAENGGCSVTTQDQCFPPAVWSAGQISCTPNPCPQPAACCDPTSESCSLTLESACLSPGIWHPGWTSCGPNPCPQGDVLLFDHFDNAVLDPAWSLSYVNLAGSSYVEAASRLEVTDLQPGNTNKWSKLRFTQTDSICGDFTLDYSLAWDSEGQTGAAQNLFLSLIGPSGTFAQVGYHDPWGFHRGERSAFVGALTFAGGMDDLPLEGQASVCLERADGLMTISWDGQTILSGVAASMITRIQLSFEVLPMASFGSESVDFVRLAGRGTCPSSGACCWVDVCYLRTQAECEASGFVFQGSGTVCDLLNLCLISGTPPMAAGKAEGFLGGIPNPFAARVALWLSLRKAEQARIEIFDAGGRRLQAIDWGTLTPGLHVYEWDGRETQGKPVSPGVYFARLTAGGRSWIRPLVRVR